MVITEVRIKLVEENNERLMAFCSVTLDNAFATSAEARDLRRHTRPRPLVRSILKSLEVIERLMAGIAVVNRLACGRSKLALELSIR